MNSKKQRFLLGLLLIASASTAQRDSSLTLTAGVNYSWDHYGFLAANVFQLQDRFSSSLYVTAQGTKYFGQSKKIGLGLEPKLGISQAAFNALIPNTDFDNQADSMVFVNSDVLFYRKGEKLAREKYNYRINYMSAGLNVHLLYRTKNNVRFSLYLGVFYYQFVNKNYKSFSLEIAEYNHQGIQSSYRDVLYIPNNFFRTREGFDITIPLHRRLDLRASFDVMSKGIRFDRPSWEFYNTAPTLPGHYFGEMSRCFSTGLGVMFLLTK